jgi:hypothetical protein
MATIRARIIGRVDCPKCRAVLPATAAECPRCGIIVAKYLEREGPVPRPIVDASTSMAAAVGRGIFLLFIPFGAAVAIWWAGENLIDVAPYINDARELKLVLLGGKTGAEVEGHEAY